MIASQSWIRALRWGYVSTELLFEADLMHQNLQQWLFSLEFLMSPSRQKQIKKEVVLQISSTVACWICSPLLFKMKQINSRNKDNILAPKSRYGLVHKKHTGSLYWRRKLRAFRVGCRYKPARKDSISQVPFACITEREMLVKVKPNRGTVYSFMTKAGPAYHVEWSLSNMHNDLCKKEKI